MGKSGGDVVPQVDLNDRGLILRGKRARGLVPAAEVVIDDGFKNKKKCLTWLLCH